MRAASGIDDPDELGDQRAYEHGLIDDALGAGWRERLVIFGCGQIGRDALKGLRTMGIAVHAFADNDRARWGKTVDGLPVVAPEDLAGLIAQPSVVIAIWRSAPVIEQLACLGVTTAVSFKALFWHRPGLFLPYLRLDRPSRMLEAKPRIMAVAKSLADARSKHEFDAQLNWLGSFASYELPSSVTEEQYFAFDLFEPRADDVFVDCGAYDGDTVQTVLREWPTGVVVHALEPDPANLAALEAWRRDLPGDVARAVQVHPYASADCRRALRFSSAGAGSSVTDGGDIIVEAIALDELFANTRVTIIKMDIEGAEIDALRGAMQLMRRDRPIVAACLYHRQEHLWEVPEALSTAVPSYRLFIRRYGDEYGDVVCYAVPPERLLA